MMREVKVDNPHSVTFLLRHVAMCLKEIGLRAENIIAIQGSIVNINWGPI